MVDFKKRLTRKTAKKPTDPIELYNTLDRAYDKGPLRPAQLAVLGEWYKRTQNDRDVIVKLHTGQGKTLIGLLFYNLSSMRTEARPFFSARTIFDRTSLRPSRAIRHRYLHS